MAEAAAAAGGPAAIVAAAAAADGPLEARLGGDGRARASPPRAPPLAWRAPGGAQRHATPRPTAWRAPSKRRAASKADARSSAREVPAAHARGVRTACVI